ncbi:S-adenosyl-L-methionine-dependent methyltransferase [Umbelopsis sp. PMI_123]|nr:S-adenosyl-L-methionine-dependent methyltransferase [Umbelopsis sp. PMI_123]
MGNVRSVLMRKDKNVKRGIRPSSKVTNPSKVVNSSITSTPSSGSGTKATQSRIIGGREFHTEEKSVYVLAKDDEEKDRLHEQHFLIKESFGNLLKPELMAPLFEKEIDVYDVGCGPASWILDMATDYPHINFFGTDIADTFPQSIYPKNCHFSLGNVLEDNPFGKRFDFIQMRYFAVALRAEEWDAAYKSMYNQLKPGGYFQVLEPSILMNTPDSDLSDVISAFTSLLAAKGQDYDIGPKIVDKMQLAGFNVIYEDKRESPIGWGNKMCVRGAEDMRMLYLSITPFLASQMKLDVEAAKDKINRACDAMGPTKTTVNMWSFLAQKPLDAPESKSSS